MDKKNIVNMENDKNAKSGDINAACARYGLGKNRMRDVAAEAGAVIRIGRRYLVNFTKMDKYMDSISM